MTKGLRRACRTLPYGVRRFSGAQGCRLQKIHEQAVETAFSETPDTGPQTSGSTGTVKPDTEEMKKTLRIDAADVFRIGLFAALLAGLYWSTYSWLILHDWAREDFTYGYLIPFIAGYLVWEKSPEVAEIPSTPSWAGFCVLLLGTALFWLGELGGEFFILYVSSWLIVFGLLWLHMGLKKLRPVVFGLCFSLAMFPIPNFLYNKVSVNLKLASSKLGVWMMQTWGMSAYREGNVIDLGFTQLQVVDACSGLRYLIPLVVLGVLLAYFYKARLWKKAIVVAVTLPLSIITNSLRIAVTGILYEIWGPVAAEGFFHGFSGWFIFMFTFAVLLGLMWCLNRLFPDPKDDDEDEDLQEGGVEVESTAEPMDEESGAPGGTGDVKRRPSFLRPAQAMAALVVLGASLVLAQGVEFREKTPIAAALDRFPLEIGKWEGRRQTMEQRFIDTLDLSDYTIIDFRNGNGRNVNFYVAYYESQRKGESIHSPSTCLPGSGWIFKQSGTVMIPADAAGNAIRVKRAYMQKGEYKQLSYFWFPQRGRILTNAYQLKIFAFWDALTRHRTDGALVRLITPVYDDESPADAENRMKSLTKDLIPVLNQFLPG